MTYMERCVVRYLRKVVLDKPRSATVMLPVIAAIEAGMHLRDGRR